jgi:hypothetical protein
MKPQHRAKNAPHPKYGPPEEAPLNPEALSRITDLILEGHVDPAVEQRAFTLGWSKPRRKRAPPAEAPFEPLEGRA